MIRKMGPSGLVLLTICFASPARTTADSLALSRPIAHKGIRNAAVAGAGIVAGDALLQLTDHYILDLDYAHISRESVRNNFRTGFVWDNDGFFLNQTGHPLAGAGYHLIARSSGLSYWASAPFNLLGSAGWEMFCESDPPSLNDIFTTTCGGMALGEVGWRLASLIFSKKEIGFPLKVSAGLASNAAVAGTRAEGTKANAMAVVDIRYGDAFSCGKPYDYFLFHTGIGYGGGKYVPLEVNVLGELWGRTVAQTDHSRTLVGIFQHFNTSSTAHLAETASFGPGVIYSSGAFEQHFHLSGILLGTSRSDWFSTLDRSYSFGNGYGFKSLSSWDSGNGLRLELAVRQYHLFTTKEGDNAAADPLYTDGQGTPGAYFTISASPAVHYDFSRHFSLFLCATCIWRNAAYRHHPAVSDLFCESRAGICWKL